MKKYFLLLSILFSISSEAQWVSRAPFPGVSRAKAASFTVNNKIYLMGGVDNLSNILRDFWEYDIATNTWTQQTAFPGPERYGAAAFTLNNKGYIATGGNDNGYLYDLWEFNPATSSWLQKVGLPNGQAQHENQRAEAYAFVINNKAYVGGGNGWVFGANSTNNYAFPDLWEFDPMTNSWTQKSSVPDFVGKNMSIAVAINNKAYIGLGCNVGQTVNYQSFWEYDPSNDTWTAKADFPTLFTTDAAAFESGGALYVAGGVNLNTITLTNQIHKYDAVTDQWIPVSNFNGGAIAGQIAGSTGTRAFMGSGYNSSLNTRNDFWEFSGSTTAVMDPQQAVLNVYPNPANDVLRIHFNEEIISAKIFDLTGKEVINIRENIREIRVAELLNGYYFLILEFSNGNKIRKSFIKE